MESNSPDAKANKTLNCWGELKMSVSVSCRNVDYHRDWVSTAWGPVNIHSRAEILIN